VKKIIEHYNLQCSTGSTTPLVTYFYLALVIVYLPLSGMYYYQKNNKKYDDFKWGSKTESGYGLRYYLRY